MVPERPDLVIINHGHNESTIPSALANATRLTNLATQYEPMPTTVITIQNPRMDAKAKFHQDLGNALTKRFQNSRTRILDVAGGVAGDWEHSRPIKLGRISPQCSRRKGAGFGGEICVRDLTGS